MSFLQKEVSVLLYSNISFKFDVKCLSLDDLDFCVYKHVSEFLSFQLSPQQANYGLGLRCAFFDCLCFFANILRSNLPLG